METECRLPLLRKRAPCLPAVAMKLDGAFGGLGERRDAAPARVAAVAHRPAVVQRLPPGLGERDLGIRPEPDRGQLTVDPDALTPCLGDPARDRPVHPETQPAPPAPSPYTPGRLIVRTNAAESVLGRFVMRSFLSSVSLIAALHGEEYTGCRRTARDREILIATDKPLSYRMLTDN